MKTLYIIVYNYLSDEDEDDFDWIWSSQNENTTIKNWLQEYENRNLTEDDVKYILRVPEAVHSQDIINQIDRYLTKPLKRR